MTQPTTQTVSLSDDALKILRWLAAHGSPYGYTACQIAKAILEGRICSTTLGLLRRKKFVQPIEQRRWRITPAGRAFIEQLDGKNNE